MPRYNVHASPWHSASTTQITTFLDREMAIENARYTNRLTGQAVTVLCRGHRVFFLKGDPALRRKTWAAYNTWDGNVHDFTKAMRRVRIAAMKHRKDKPK